MSSQELGLSKRLAVLKTHFAERYDETLVRNYLAETERFERLPLLGAGAVFAARRLPSGLVLKVAHDGLENDKIYKGKWLAALQTMQAEGGVLPGWPLYRVLTEEHRLGLVTLPLVPGLAMLGPQSGEIADVKRGIEEALRSHRLRLTDTWQWGTYEGLPFVMDLSDIDT